MIADMKANKTFTPIVTELFMRDRKLNISLAFISQLYFQVFKENTLQKIASINRIKPFD